MLLSAGLGSRMAPLTNTCPKPLLKVGGRPQIDYIVEGFKSAEVNNFIINAWYLSDQIQAHFRQKINSTVIVETERLETGGGIKNALPYLDNIFFASNTDSIICNVDLSIKKMQDMFDNTMDGLLLLVPKINATGYIGTGDFSLNTDGTIVRNSNGEYVFSGVQILRKSAFNETPNGAFSLNILYNTLLKKGKLKGCIHYGGWYHISTPSDVEKANTLCKQGLI